MKYVLNFTLNSRAMPVLRHFPAILTQYRYRSVYDVVEVVVRNNSFVLDNVFIAFNAVNYFCHNS